jgi:phosphoglycerate kinase
MKTLENMDVEGEKVLLRTDLNLPVEDGEPQKTVRFERYLETIKELSNERAKVVVVAHQGRPARKDFLSLEKHSRLLSKNLNQDVEFVSSFFGPELGEKVARMNEGDVAMLENIRFLSEELQNASPKHHAQDFFIQKLSQYFDMYIDDAFSAAHRSHSSMVGFTETLDSYAGPIMQKELESCRQVQQNFENGLLVLGGEKTSDLIGIMDEMIEQVDKVLLGGVPGELALSIKGHNLGEKQEWIEKKGLDSNNPELERLLNQHSDKIILPRDLKTASGNHKVQNLPAGMTWDIGEETIQKFKQEIQKADSIVMKGPMGAFENHPKGTKQIVEAIAETDAYTVLGGGHTSSLVQRFNHDLKEFSHVSIAGGAFVRYMSGEKLPAIEALKN